MTARGFPAGGYRRSPAGGRGFQPAPRPARRRQFPANQNRPGRNAFRPGAVPAPSRIPMTLGRKLIRGLPLPAPLRLAWTLYELYELLGDYLPDVWPWGEPYPSPGQGWYKYLDCIGLGDYNNGVIVCDSFESIKVPAWNCGTQVFDHSCPAPPAPWPEIQQWTRWAQHAFRPLSRRRPYWIYWRDNIPAPDEVPETVPAVVPMPAIPPWFPPEWLPPLAPAPRPATRPATPTRVQPHSPTRRGPRPVPRPRPDPEFVPIRPARPGRPGPTIVLTPGPDGKIKQDVRPPARQNPRRRDPAKERKVKITMANGVMTVIGFLTETGDFIDAVWSALPEEFQTRKANQVERVQDLYDHFDKIDLEAALEAVALNQMEDMLIGTLAGSATEAFAEALHDMGHGDILLPGSKLGRATRGFREGIDAWEWLDPGSILDADH